MLSSIKYCATWKKFVIQVCGCMVIKAKILEELGVKIWDFASVFYKFYCLINPIVNQSEIFLSHLVELLKLHLTISNTRSNKTTNTSKKSPKLTGIL